MPIELDPPANSHFLDVMSVPALSKGDCDRVLSLLDHAAWRSARVTDEDDPYGTIDPEVRSVLSQPLPICSDGWPLQPILDAISAANGSIWRFDLWGFSLGDHPSVLRYEAQVHDHFNPHLDAGEHAPSRKLSFSLQLNEPSDYLGGDLVLGRSHLTGSREKGWLTIFPAISAHEVTPVYTGVRHAIVGWVHGPTFR